MKRIALITLIISMLIAYIPVVAENNDEYIEEQSEEQNAFIDDALVLTLSETINLTLENNMDKRVSDKQMKLQDIQLDISGDANTELKKLERDMRSFADQLSTNVLDLQREIGYVKSLDFTTTISTDDGDIETEILNVHYDDLMQRPMSRQFLMGINEELSLISLGDEPARFLPPSVLIEALEEAKAQAGEAYFDIQLGHNEVVKQANSMATSVLGLQSTRRLNIEDAVDIIRTKTDNAVQLLIKSDTDVIDGFKLLAESSFYGLLQSEKMLAVQEKAYLRISEQYRNAYHTYNQGLMSSGDLQLVNLQYNSAKISVKSAEVDRDKALMDFNQAVGLPFETKVKVVDPQYQEIDFSLDQALTISYENRTDMFTAKQELDLAEKNLEYVDKKHREKSIEYQESLAYYELKDMEYKNTWVKAKSSIYKAYFDWQNAKYAYELSIDNLELMRKQLDIAQVAYDLGYSATSGSPMANLLQVQEQYASLEQALASAEFGRNLAVQNYLKEIGYSYHLKQVSEKNN